MNYLKRIHLLLIAALFISSGCTVDSSDIKTSGMDATITVSSTGSNSTSVNVSLISGSDDVKLIDGDVLVSTRDGVRKTLSKLSSGSYETTFSSDTSAAYTIELQRPNDPNASSSVNLPAPFSITAPTKNQLFASGTNVDVQWTPAISSVLDYAYSTSCTDTAGGSVQKSDTISVVGINGGYTIASANLLPTGIDPNITCVCNVNLIRQVQGTISPALKSGSTITASQTRNISFLINP
ncbi:MAG: hypothetical protein Q9M44_03955 [Ghiorsea sp.]|nr:hypothetical protein [Ghiorsea sp.]